MARERFFALEDQETNVDRTTSWCWRDKPSFQPIDDEVERVHLDDLSEISLPVPYPWLEAKDDVVPFQIAPEYYFDDCFGTPEAPHGYPISPLFDLVGSLYSDSPPPSPLSSSFSTPISTMAESLQLPSLWPFEDHADVQMSTHPVPGDVEVSPTSHTPALSPTVNVSSSYSTPYSDDPHALPPQPGPWPHSDAARDLSSHLGFRPSNYTDASCSTSHHPAARRFDVRRDRRRSPYPSSARRHSCTSPSPEEDVGSSNTSSNSAGYLSHSSGFASSNVDRLQPKNTFRVSVAAWTSSSVFSSSDHPSHASIQAQQPVAPQPHHSRTHSHPYRRPPAEPRSPGSSTARPYDPTTQTSSTRISPISSSRPRTYVRQLTSAGGRRKRAKPQALKLESDEDEEHHYAYRVSPTSPPRSASPDPRLSALADSQKSPSNHSRGQTTPVLVSPSVDHSGLSTLSDAPSMRSPSAPPTKQAPHNRRGTCRTSCADNTPSSLIDPAPTLSFSTVVRRSTKRTHTDEDKDYVSEDEIDDGDDDDEYKPGVKPFKTCLSATRRNATTSSSRKDSARRRPASITKGIVELPALTPVTSCTSTSAHPAGPSIALNDSMSTSINIHRTPHVLSASPDYSPSPSTTTAPSTNRNAATAPETEVNICIPSFKRSGQTRYSCVYCTTDFSRRNDVYRHIRVAHGGDGTEFVCVCGKVLSRGDALRRHQRTCSESRDRMRQGDADVGKSGKWEETKNGVVETKGLELRVTREEARRNRDEGGSENGVRESHNVSMEDEN